MKRIGECRMKKLIVILILLLFAAGAVVYLKFTGVTHEEIRRTVTSESGAIRTVIDDRYRKLDEKLDAVESRLGGKLGDAAGSVNGKFDSLAGKLDRIEGKLDRILELANQPPLPDGMPRAK